MKEKSAESPPVGVVVVTYCAESFIAECLDGLRACHYPDLRVVVVDNASPDGTVEAIRRWARSALAPANGSSSRGGAPWLRLFETGANLGFAGGLNVGLSKLMEDQEIDLFWVLNPDAVPTPEAPAAFVRKAAELGIFATIGGRLLITETELNLRKRTGARVHSDGGRLHPLSYTAVNVNMGTLAEQSIPPPAETLDYVTGANLLASRAFIERAGLLDEGWFLYYEEIDWQLRRGDMVFGVAPEAVVYHRGGASIGSGSQGGGASPLAIYFLTRNLLPFVARWSPWRLPFAYAMAWWKFCRKWGAGGGRLASMLRGLHGFAPPAAVRARLGEEVVRAIKERRPVVRGEPRVEVWNARPRVMEAQAEAARPAAASLRKEP